MDRPPSSVITRRIVAGCLFVAGVVLLLRVPDIAGNWAAFPKLMGGLAGLLGGVVLASPEIVRWALTPLSGLVDSILLPSEKVVPPADLKLAHFYGRALRYAEAAEEYERILEHHPDHAEACLEGIRAAGLAGDERLAKKFYLTARRLLRAQDQRRLLEDVYAARHQPLENLEEVIVEALPPEEPEAPAPDRP